MFKLENIVEVIKTDSVNFGMTGKIVNIHESWEETHYQVEITNSEYGYYPAKSLKLIAKNSKDDPLLKFLDA